MREFEENSKCCKIGGKFIDAIKTSLRTISPFLSMFSQIFMVCTLDNKYEKNKPIPCAAANVHCLACQECNLFISIMTSFKTICRKFGVLELHRCAYTCTFWGQNTYCQSPRIDQGVATLVYIVFFLSNAGLTLQ